MYAVVDGLMDRFMSCGVCLPACGNYLSVYFCIVHHHKQLFVLVPCLRALVEQGMTTARHVHTGVRHFPHGRFSRLEALKHLNAFGKLHPRMACSSEARSPTAAKY